MSNAIAIRPTNNRDFFGLSSDQILKDMQSIHDDIERVAFGLFQQRGANGESALHDWLRAESTVVRPVPISIQDNGDKLIVTADVPGFSMDELKVHTDGSELRICGKSEVSDRKGKEDSTTTRRICCTVTLPSAVNAENASATLESGVLNLKLPKAAPPKEIEVKVAA